MRRIRIYKSVVILFVLFYIVLSFFPCVKIQTWKYVAGEETCTVDYTNNLSALMIIALILQVALLFLNRRKLQLVFGIIGTLPGIILPLSVEVMRIVDDAICIIGSHTERFVTSLGWIVTFIAWVLLVLDILITGALKHYTAKTISATN